MVKRVICIILIFAMLSISGFAQTTAGGTISTDFSSEVDTAQFNIRLSNATSAISNGQLVITKSTPAGVGNFTNKAPIAFDDILRFYADIGYSNSSSTVTAHMSSSVGVRMTANTSTPGAGNGSVWFIPGRVSNTVTFFIRSATTIAGSGFVVLDSLNTKLGGSLGGFQGLGSNSLKNVKIEDNGEWIKFYLKNDADETKCVASIRTYRDVTRYVNDTEFNAIDIYYGDGSSSNSELKETVKTTEAVVANTTAGIVRLAAKSSVYYAVGFYACDIIIDNFKIEWDKDEVVDPGEDPEDVLVPGSQFLANFNVYDTALNSQKKDASGNGIPNNALWNVTTNLQNNPIQEFYADRTGLTVADIPNELLGAERIQTTNDSKSFKGDPLVKFKVLKDVEVYIAHINGRNPTWMTQENGWMPISLTVGMKTESTQSILPYSMAKKMFAAGSIVSLGQSTPGDSLNNTYTVIVKEPDITVYEPGFYDGTYKTPVVGIPASGKLDVNVQVGNTRYTPITVSLLVAAYTSDKKLRAIVNKSTIVSKQSTQGIDATLAFPSDTASIKAFVWKDTENISPMLNKSWVLEKMRSIIPTYPNGKLKAVTISYDDGRVQDEARIKILNDNGLKATFNINSIAGIPAGFVGTKEQWLEQNNLWYAGHEIASHTANHPALSRSITVDEMKAEVEPDQVMLGRIFGQEIRGFAYPFGGPTKVPNIIQALKELGVQYARPCLSSSHDELINPNYDIPTDFMEWWPNCHIRNLDTVGTRFMNIERPTKMILLYAWGHSTEAATQFNDFCVAAGKRTDIWFATNIEVVDYVNATRKLIITDESVTNTSNQTVWVTIDGVLTSINAGQVIALH